MTSRLETPVPLLQHHGEFGRLLDLYRASAPTHVLEVGTYHGGSLYHWLRNATPGATIVSIDSYTTGVDNSALYPEWGEPNVERVVVICGDSNSPRIAAMAAEHGPYDWIYIDADHRLANVEQDWRLYSQLATPDATIVLHDISESDDPSIQVAPLWAELKADPAWHTSEITSDGGWGIGVLTRDESF